MRRLIWLAVLLGSAVGRVSAQSPEWFHVQYEGGDSHLDKTPVGILVLTDSDVALHKCATYTCEGTKHGMAYAPDILLSIPLVNITAVNGRNNRVGASATNWATGDETVTLTYDTKTTAEAPVFKTMLHESAQVSAKIQFLLRKLRKLPADTPAGATDTILPGALR